MLDNETEEILEDTKSIDKKLWILIGLWVLDKIIIFGMLWFMKYLK